jgi:general secretion pathway protein L
MNAAEILNADLGTVGRWISEGFAWWVDELAGLAPSGLRTLFAPPPPVLAEFAPGAERYRFWREGRMVEIDDPGKAPVGLLLGPSEVLLRTVELPLMPLRDLRRMAELDIDRLTPFRVDAVHLAVEILQRDPTHGRQLVLIGVWPRGAAAAALERAQEHNLDPVAIKVRPAPGEAPRLDFLPQIARARGSSGEARGRLWWWTSVAVLLAANIAVLVGRDMADVGRLKATIEAERGTVMVAERVRQKLQTENKARSDLLARRAAGDPLRVIDAVTRVLPPSAWVQHLEWNGRAIRLVGYRAATFDLAAAIRNSPAFANPRLATTETPAKVGGASFDLVADARRAH